MHILQTILAKIDIRQGVKKEILPTLLFFTHLGAKYNFKYGFTSYYIINDVSNWGFYSSFCRFTLNARN